MTSAIRAVYQPFHRLFGGDEGGTGEPGGAEVIGEVGTSGPCITPAVEDCVACENAGDVGPPGADTEGDCQEEEVGVGADLSRPVALNEPESLRLNCYGHPSQVAYRLELATPRGKRQRKMALRKTASCLFLH